jgi:IclR family transcriptional regulator, pca regulon regulatory protein
VGSDALIKLAQPVLGIISEQIKESSSLAVLNSQVAVFVARSPHRRSLTSGLGIGARLPAYCSATGRGLLGETRRDEFKHMQNRMARPALTPRTRTSISLYLEKNRCCTPL